MDRFMRCGAMLVAGLLAGCRPGAVKDDWAPAVSPDLVEVPVATFVPISEELTARCRWRDTAPLEEMPAVANERKRCLRFYEANLGAISKIQGKPVPVPAIKRKDEGADK